ncbi:MAG: class I SAM-dependent methyltransferase [Candidatus Micrarchaeia archaeon]|jgi:SAM-dependent methyltransferase
MHLHTPKFIRKLCQPKLAAPVQGIGNPALSAAPCPAIDGSAPKAQNPFMVMDLAGDGNFPAYSELSALKGRRVIIKAVNSQNNQELDLEPRSLKGGNNSFYKYSDKTYAIGDDITVISKAARLPECLAAEPSGSYDHVHFHMFWPDFKPFGDKEADFLVREINRLLKPGGLAFVSADPAFFKAFSREGQEKLPFLRDLLARNFSLVYSFFFPAHTFNEPEVRDEGKLGQILGFLDYLPKMVNYPHLIFEDFGDYSGQANYFAICEKPAPKDDGKIREG